MYALSIWSGIILNQIVHQYVILLRCYYIMEENEHLHNIQIFWVTHVTMQLTGTYRHWQQLNLNIHPGGLVLELVAALLGLGLLGGSLEIHCRLVLFVWGQTQAKGTLPGWKFSLCLWGRLCHYFIYYFDCFANKLQIISGSSACVCCVFCILLCLGEGDTILCHAVILSVWHSSWCPASVISEIKLIKTIADFSFLLGLWFYTYVVCKQHQLWSDKKKMNCFHRGPELDHMSLKYCEIFV